MYVNYFSVKLEKNIIQLIKFAWWENAYFLSISISFMRKRSLCINLSSQSPTSFLKKQNTLHSAWCLTSGEDKNWKMRAGSCLGCPVSGNNGEGDEKKNPENHEWPRPVTPNHYTIKFPFFNFTYVLCKILKRKLLTNDLFSNFVNCKIL